MSERCWAVVPAAGVGRRMQGELPKQYLELCGTPLLEHSLRALLACEEIAGICVAFSSADEHTGKISAMADARVRRTEGASERAGSVLAGLRALSEDAAGEDWVLVHDAARPCLRPADVRRLIEAVRAADCGGILAEPVVDTVKEVAGDGRVTATLNRQRLWRAQTPQMFRLGELCEALMDWESAGAAITDEASAMERAGYAVMIVAGGPHNLKVTVPSDLPLAEFYLSHAGAP